MAFKLTSNLIKELILGKAKARGLVRYENFVDDPDGALAMYRKDAKESLKHFLKEAENQRANALTHYESCMRWLNEMEELCTEYKRLLKEEESK